MSFFLTPSFPQNFHPAPVIGRYLNRLAHRRSHDDFICAIRRQLVMLQKTFLQNTSEKGPKNRTAKEASSTQKELGLAVRLLPSARLPHRTCDRGPRARPEGWRAPLRGHLPHSALQIRRACYSKDLGTGVYATCGARSRRLGGCSRSFRRSRQGRRRHGRRSDAAAEAIDQRRRRRSIIRW